jgi:hypothetical protein
MSPNHVPHYRIVSLSNARASPENLNFKDEEQHVSNCFL